jgi:hypothetical protein
MALVYKRLGALDGNAALATPLTLYTASNVAGTSTVVSTLAICNASATNYLYRVAISTATTYQTSGYLVFDAPVSANDTIFLTLGVTLDPSARFLLVSSNNASVKFSVFGVENS